nr:hypothetical protein [Porphyromonas macacae]
MTDERGHVFDFLFDREHRPIQLTYPNGSVHQWRYDAWGHLGEECDVRGNHTFYRSDEAGNLLWMREPDGNEHHFSYDTSGNLIHARDQLREVSFRYGSLGTLLSRTQNGVRFVSSTIRSFGSRVYRTRAVSSTVLLWTVVATWWTNGASTVFTAITSATVRGVCAPGLTSG